MNIFVILFIFACLITILFAFYGNYFIDKLDKRTGEIARNFILSNQFVTDTIKLTHVVNTDKITPLLRNDLLQSFNCLTLDC